MEKNNSSREQCIKSYILNYMSVEWTRKKYEGIGGGPSVWGAWGPGPLGPPLNPGLTCVVTRAYNTFGVRAFWAAGPGLWISLPSHLKDADISYSEFRQLLKTFLFGQWGHGAVWTVLTALSRNILTYLLMHLCCTQWLEMSACWL